ncbi:MAG: hypothetical protein EB060_06940 [Proteobacteria bacterium]|nr:hypothetical protein [Pseudomonadota bacterium]
MDTAIQLERHYQNTASNLLLTAFSFTPGASEEAARLIQAKYDLPGFHTFPLHTKAKYLADELAHLFPPSILHLARQTPRADHPNQLIVLENITVDGQHPHLIEGVTLAFLELSYGQSKLVPRKIPLKRKNGDISAYGEEWHQDRPLGDRIPVSTLSGVECLVTPPTRFCNMGMLMRSLPPEIRAVIDIDGRNYPLTGSGFTHPDKLTAVDLVQLQRHGIEAATAIRDVPLEKVREVAEHWLPAAEHFMLEYSIGQGTMLWWRNERELFHSATVGAPLTHLKKDDVVRDLTYMGCDPTQFPD